MASQKAQESQVRNLLEQLKSHAFGRPGLVRKLWCEERDKPIPDATLQKVRDPRQTGRQVQVKSEDVLSNHPDADELIERVKSSVSFDGLHALFNDIGIVLGKASFARNVVALAFASRARAVDDIPDTHTRPAESDHSVKHTAEGNRKRLCDDAFDNEKSALQPNKKQAIQTVEAEVIVNSYQDATMPCSPNHAAIKAEHSNQDDIKPNTPSDATAERQRSTTMNSSLVKVEQVEQNEMKPSAPSDAVIEEGRSATNIANLLQAELEARGNDAAHGDAIQFPGRAKVFKAQDDFDFVGSSTQNHHQIAPAPRAMSVPIDV